MTGGKTDQRESADFYKTPRHAIDSLLEREKFEGIIWECACGDGAISKAIKGNVISTDLFDRGFGEFGVNFLAEKRSVNHIITNPPYSMAKQFIYHALNQADQKVAMLLKLNFLESQNRKKMFETTPLRTVYVFSKRISFDMGKKSGKGKGLLAFAWFVWERGYQGKPTIEWI